jgi:hypothetical protein
VIHWEKFIDGKPLEDISWEYGLYENLYFPKKYTYSLFADSSKEPRTSRVMTLKEVKFNNPILPATFDISHLDLKYGDRYVDNIVKTLTVYDGKSFVPATDFVYVTDRPKARGTSLFVSVTLALLPAFVITAALLMRLRARRSCSLIIHSNLTVLRWASITETISASQVSRAGISATSKSPTVGPSVLYKWA